MSSKIKALCVKHREIIVYIIVGVLTTIFCWTLCFIGEHFIFDVNKPFQNFLNNTIDWVAGVSFSFPLNRKWVFKSRNPKWVGEFLKFALSRVSTWFLDVLVMFIFVNVWTFIPLFTRWLGKIGWELTSEGIEKVNYWFAKIFISSVLVMVVNYIFSKLLVFKKKKDADEASVENA